MFSSPVNTALKTISLQRNGIVVVSGLVVVIILPPFFNINSPLLILFDMNFQFPFYLDKMLKKTENTNKNQMFFLIFILSYSLNNNLGVFLVIILYLEE